MATEVRFDGNSPSRLMAAGFQVNFRSHKIFAAEFELEGPCVIDGTVHTDLPFTFGAFSANYGGRLRAARIGRYCSISADVQMGWDEHPTDWITSSMAAYVNDIHGWATRTGHPSRKISNRFSSMRGITTIGHDVWIGYGVFLQAGVTIGNGAIIAARSVVLKNVPPYCIVGGSPARIIRLRYPPPVSSELDSLQWWRYNIHDFDQTTLSDPTTFIPYFKKLQKQPHLEQYNPRKYGPKELAHLANVPTT